MSFIKRKQNKAGNGRRTDDTGRKNTGRNTRDTWDEETEYYPENEWDEYEEDYPEEGYSEEGDLEEEYSEEEYPEEEYAGEDYPEEEYSEEEYTGEDYSSGEDTSENDYYEEDGSDEDAYGQYAGTENGYEEEEDAFEYEEADYAADMPRRTGNSRRYSSYKTGKTGQNRNRRRQKKNPFTAAIYRFHSLPATDKILAITGAAVLCCAVLTGTVFAATSMSKKQVASFSDVGTDLESVNVIGESGLVAMNNAKAAEVMSTAAASTEAASASASESSSAVPENITVKLKTTSILKDLKLKFVNASSGKLIASVPFEAKVTGPDNKTSTWKDDDGDGIIYKTGLTGGTYKVQMMELGSQYSNYTIDSNVSTVQVKDKIAYQKVDVVEEVKTEAQVNVAKEDTAVTQTPIQSKLTDTVPFVEATATVNGTGSYNKIDKSTIADPGASARLNLTGFHFMSALSGTNASATVSLSSGTAAVTVGSTVVLTAKASSSQDVSENNQTTTKATDLSSSVVWSSSDTSVATVSGGTVTGVKAGTAVITASVSGASAVCTVTVTDKASLTLNPTTLTIAVGKTGTTAAALTPSGAAVSAVSSSDTAIATVSCSGTTITVTGVKAGTATITVKGSNSITATCTVTVKSSAASDTSTKLKDKSGNQIYVLDNGNYREAVYADYYNFDTFYIQTTQTLYTGWQNLDGKTYYYLADHTCVKGDQVIQGAKYSFDNDGVMKTGSGAMGIDVSKWNGNISWGDVKKSGAAYAIIRCGYRGSSTGALITDPKFAANISGAASAGLKVGVYFFTQAVNEAEAIEEASMVLSQISQYKISYPVFLDVEGSNGRGDAIDSGTRTAVCKAFCATIQNSGYTAGVYSNNTWLTGRMDAGALSSYKIWLAQYAAAPTYSGRYNMWQYTSKGTVAGVSGKVDLNLSYLGY